MKRHSDAERAAEKDAAQWKAREEALAMGLRRKDGAGTLLARADHIPGLLGSVAALLSVDAGHEAALAAALGALADAVAVSNVDDAVASIELLKSDDAGRAALLIASAAACSTRARSSGSRCRPARPGRSTWSAHRRSCDRPWSGRSPTSSSRRICRPRN